jgi:predicted hotdog family 3-hydroxylacyl-ACP dehydratase
LNVADLNVCDLVPHSGAMSLIDTLIGATDTTLKACCTVRNDGLFNLPDGRVPAMAAVEYMAQTVAAFGGVRSHGNGESIKPGLLLGARNFSASAAYLTPGDRLEITVTLVIENVNGLAVFDCEITGPDVHATARLTVITTDSLSELAAAAAAQ